MKHTTTTYLEVARTAVSQACIVTRYVQSRLDQIRAITKEDKSPVTIADLCAQAIIAKALFEKLPPMPLIAEEDADYLRDPKHRAHLEAALEATRLVWPEVTAERFLHFIDLGRSAGDARPAAFWTLDPVDGTKGFVRGRQYAVALAGVTLGKPVMAVLGCPNLPLAEQTDYDAANLNTKGSMYFAAAGEGAFAAASTDPTAPGELMTLQPFSTEPTTEVRLVRSAEAAHGAGGSIDRMMVRVDKPYKNLKLDSQCKYAILARGHAEGYLRIPPQDSPRKECIWDHAAGVLIAEEAGMKVTDCKGIDLDFSVGSRLDKNRGVVAAHPDLHASFIEAIAKL